MKQKRIYRNLFGIFLLITIFLTGCGKEEEKDVIKIESPEAGLVFQISKEYQEKGIKIEGPFEDFAGNDSIGIFWYYTPVTDKLVEDLMALSEEEFTEEILIEFYKQMGIHSKCLMNITIIEEQNYKEAIESGRTIDELSDWNPVEEFGINDGYVYLLSIPENDTSGMEEKEKTQYEECSAYMQTVKKNLSFMKKEAVSNVESLFPEQIPAFTAKDLDGNTVTESIFAEKDLTVVNIWGTFCTPCVQEMPELGEWAKSMPDNVQIVGLIADISGDEDTKRHDLAVTITEKANADFTQIIANADFASIMNWVTGVPTTLFVDKEGKLVGEPIIGADVAGYKKFVEDYFSEQ